MANNSEYAVMYANSAGLTALPAAPVKEGLTFAGWSTEEEGTEANFGQGATVSEDMTVYAVFTDQRLDGTDTPTDNPPDTPTSNNPNDTPKTGDESNLALWFSLIILSMLGIMVTVLTPIIGRKKLVNTNGRHMRK